METVFLGRLRRTHQVKTACVIWGVLGFSFSFGLGGLLCFLGRVGRLDATLWQQLRVIPSEEVNEEDFDELTLQHSCVNFSIASFSMMYSCSVSL